MAYEHMDLSEQNEALESLSGEDATLASELAELDDARDTRDSGYDDINRAYDETVKGLGEHDREGRQTASNDHLDAVLTRAQNHDMAVRLKQSQMNWQHPDHWNEATREAYERADPTVRAAMMDATALETPAKQVHAAWGQEMADAYGVDTATAANIAFMRERQLRTGSEQERLAAYAQLGRDYGLDLSKAAEVAQRANHLETVIGERDRQWQDRASEMITANNEINSYFAAHPDAVALEGPMTEIAREWAKEGVSVTPAHLPYLHRAGQMLQDERDAVAENERIAKARRAGSSISGGGSESYGGSPGDGSVESILNSLMQ